MFWSMVGALLFVFFVLPIAVCCVAVACAALQELGDEIRSLAGRFLAQLRRRTGRASVS